MRYLKAFSACTGIGVSMLTAYSYKAFIQQTKCDDKVTRSAQKVVKPVPGPVSLEEAIARSRDLIQRVKDEFGCPGVVIGVSVDGKDVWKEGLGFSDLENRTLCTADSIFRIASISKSITMGMVAKLWENGDLDLDKPIQQYLPQFPVKTFNGEKVDISTRQLVSHLGGIRHYDKDYVEKNSEKNKKLATTNSSSPKEDSKEKVNTSTTGKENKKEGTDNSEKQKKSEFENKEYYIKKHYNSVTDSLTLFQEDPLVFKPGDKFLYTSHGWTLISAVMEKAADKPFDKLMNEYFKALGLKNTYLEHNDPLIYNRGRHYVKNKNGRIVNAPYVDNSYKWAGGGFISDVTDLLKFGNIMLYSSQWEPPSLTGNKSKGDNSTSGTDKGDNSMNNTVLDQCITKGNLPGYLKKETVRMIFSPVDKTECSWDRGGCYGMGWAVIPEKHENGCCQHQKHYVSHTGGAIGASSVLLILPTENYGKQYRTKQNYREPYVPPKGVVVAIIANIGSVNLNPVALQISQMFESVIV